ncbi:MAG: adenylyl-sulfate kinase [Cryomorphaceae bacterium]|jgi:adenylylsulfate kinase|nr:adenylyl-sulfate kinase [Cryomorphaceae bacterium]
MNNLTAQEFSVNRIQREALHGHKSVMIWFTGLSGSGKSTLANILEAELHKQNIHTFLLDGDNIRLGLNKDLGFNEHDRSENLRRIGEVGKLMVDAGLVTIAAFVSPYDKDREMVKRILGAENFVEIFVSTPLEECIRRDVKGLYKKALNGEIKDFTGISSPYEAPKNPDLIIDTSAKSQENCLQEILTLITSRLK